MSKPKIKVNHTKLAKLFPKQKIKGRAETSAEKRAFVEKLLALWEKYPSLRFGQLILNVYGNNGFYYTEDAEFLKQLKDFYDSIPEGTT